MSNRTINLIGRCGRAFRLSFSFPVVLAIFGLDFQQDFKDARALAERINLQLRNGEYSTVYKESAPRFKTVGTEEEFIAVMQQHRAQAGRLNTAHEIAYEAHVDAELGKVQFFVYDLELERGLVREVLIFTRSVTGQMQLWKLELGPLQQK
jgi:hypothetical protein